MPPELSDLVACQEGMIARWQALCLGMSSKQADYKIASGAWRFVHPGVYATFTGQLTRSAQLWAAVLHCSREAVHSRATNACPELDAVVSHETAAYLYGLRDNDPECIHVTVPTTRRMPVAATGIKVHMSIRLDETRHPTLSPPRTRLIPTVIDLTQSARTTDDAIGWLTRGCGNRLATPDQLLEAINARKKLRRRAELVHALAGVAIGSHSVLELRYFRDVERAHSLPEGRRQRRRVTAGRATYEDVAYDDYDAVVELDGKLGHEYEGRLRDRRRDNATAERGAVPLRYGYEDVDSNPCRTALQVITVLKSNGWAGTPTSCERVGCAVADSAKDLA